MPKRLAITIAGAVSLGSYEAGVLYEIITAIGLHNRHPDTSADEKIEIDVLTGASAGGMTAVIVAQNLLYASEAFAQPQDNPLYNPWVADISLEGLLKLDSKQNPAFPDLAPEDASHSIFSSNLISRLAYKYITGRYQGDSPTARARHPAAAERIRLGLALSNLNGVGYSYPLRVVQPNGKSTFPYGRFQDEMTGLFEASGQDGQDSDAGWTPWRKAAVSCGAFPFAFRVQELLRGKREYQRHHLDPWASDAQTFTYTDGGVFQNQPLGLAKNLVDLIDHPRDGAPVQSTDSRFYLFVSPSAKTSGVNGDFGAAGAKFLPTAKALVGAVLQQAEFQDWVNAEEINDQIHVFNQRADQLYRALLDRHPTITPEALQPAANALLPGLFSTEPAPPPPRSYETIEIARARLRQQFAKESAALAKVPGDGAAREAAWIDSILVLETAAELSVKDEMYIYGITAKDSELAGTGLFAFMGFFQRDLRDYDYNVGRRKAREFLQQHRQPGPAPVVGQPEPAPDIGPIRYDPTDAIPDIRVPARQDNGDVNLSKLDLKGRQDLWQAATQRAGEILNETLAALKVNVLLAKPLAWALKLFIRGELKKRLGL